MWDIEPQPKQDNKFIRYCRTTITVLLVILIIAYLGFPFAFRYSTYVKSNLTFLNYVKVPHHADFHHPSVYGLVGAKNFYLTTEDGASLGVWHTLPDHLHKLAASLDLSDPYNTTALSLYSGWLRDATVFLYFHGCGGTRATHGRVELYRLLNQMGYHVITFDYRGFGDSSRQPDTEADVITDARTVYSWLRSHVSTGNIFFWGHSLGTGVLSHLLAELEAAHESRVTAAVMQSAFSNMDDALRDYPPSLPYSHLPGFNFFAVDPMNAVGLTFQSDRYLQNVSIPLLFLHAQDDAVVPYKLGVKLYDAVVHSRSDASTVRFVGYDRHLDYGHTRIHQDPQLPSLVQDFVENSVQIQRRGLKTHS